MIKILSKVNQKPVAIVSKLDEVSTARNDLSAPEEVLQVATKRLNKGIKFAAHRHNILERHTTETQEAWVFLRGKVLARFWDVDDSFLQEVVAEEGDVVVVYRGGHAFEVLEERTILYEFKNGPYYGQARAKTIIEENTKRNTE